MQVKYTKIKSPIGPLYLVGTDEYLLGIAFAQNWTEFKTQFDALQTGETPVLRTTEEQLGEYFAGKRRSFDIPFRLEGTAFQNRAWKALQRIPWGKTWTYKQQAAAVASPKSSRAIGQANGLNPLPIILPCHRVIGSNGTLTGYGGGLPIKQFLLHLERTS